jgi:hypothetical protein
MSACCLRCHRVIETPRCLRCYPEEPEFPPRFAVRFKPATRAPIALALPGSLASVRAVVANFLRIMRSGGAYVRRTYSGERVARTRYRAWQVYELIHSGTTSLLWVESCPIP